MRVREIEYLNAKALIVYISKQESLDESTQKKIEDYKQTYKEVSIFISGSNPIETVLRNMIQERR